MIQTQPAGLAPLPPTRRILVGFGQETCPAVARSFAAPYVRRGSRSRRGLLLSERYNADQFRFCVANGLTLEDDPGNDLYAA